jgi:mannose-6-phosphate isomerase-like protein (cupin superfamily)
MNISEFVKQSKENNLEYAVYKNWHQPTPQWDEFKALYDDATEFGRISIKDRLYTETMSYFLSESRLAYPPTDKYQFYLMQSSSFRNARPDTGTMAHTDLVDTLHWQCRGVTEWILGSKSERVLLEPGDLLWFDGNTAHATENLTEKFGLIFTPKLSPWEEKDDV